jgi:hypothetical protein
MLSTIDTPPSERQAPRIRRPSVATRELLFAMATPPLGRSDSLWPTWLAPIADTWRRRPLRTHPTETRSE